MDRAREYREYLEHQQASPSGVAGDLQRLKTDGHASAAELREFLSHLKGRSPQEVLGVVAESDLFRSILTATAGCAVLLVVLTVVPYALKDRTASVDEKKPTAAPVTQPIDEQQTGLAEKAANASEQTAAASPEPDLERAAKAMGIGGTTEADPNSNPLDSKLDKLLDGIE